MLAKSPKVTLYTGGSDGFVASTAAPIASEWNEPVLGRDFHPQWTSAFHGARRTSASGTLTTLHSFNLTDGAFPGGTDLTGASYVTFDGTAAAFHRDLSDADPGHRPTRRDHRICEGDAPQRQNTQQQEVPRDAADHQLRSHQRKVGTVVTITGVSLTQTREVTIRGVSASFRWLTMGR
jgi:hypothetical protein